MHGISDSKVRRILLKGLEQIKHNIVVHGKGKSHDTNLRNIFVVLDKYNIMLRKEKCAFGKPEVFWFGQVCNVRVWLQIQQRLQQ